MSVARSNFQRRLSTLQDSLNEPAVADGLPNEIQRNAVASLLRNGLAVLTFAITEDFIRERTAEVLSSFSSTTVRFDDLSDELQAAVTISALDGILFRSKYEDKTTKISWLLSQIPPIANASTNVSSLSKYSFGYSSPNIRDDDLGKILGAFGVAGGWTAVAAIAKRIGLGGIADYAQEFKDLANRRHSAAHSLATTIPLNDLLGSVKSVIGICCAFDLLLSKALALHNQGRIPRKQSSPLRAEDVRLRFISPHPTKSGQFSEQVEQSTRVTLRTVKVHPSESSVRAAVGAKAQRNNEYVIFHGSNGLPKSWDTWS
jgi:hypothetical protein